jgi:hypothetical protein
MKFLSIDRKHQAQAAGAWLLCGTWSADKMTDGFVPYAVMDLWEFETEVVEYLVAVGLWDHDDERNGIQFHDWAEYQPTREQLEQKRETRSEVNRKNAEKRWGNAKDMQTECETDANDMQKDAPVPEPVPEPNEGVVVKPTRKTQLQRGWKPSPAGYEYAKQNAPGMSIPIELEKFEDYNLQQNRTTADWDAAWRTWVRNAVKFDPSLATPPPPPKKQFGVMADDV